MLIMLVGFDWMVSEERDKAFGVFVCTGEMLFKVLSECELTLELRLISTMGSSMITRTCE